MKVFTPLFLFLLFFYALPSGAQTTCDSIRMDTVYVSGNMLQLTVYNSSQRVVIYPYFTLRLDDNPYITLEDSLTVPSFLSVAGDFLNGYTMAIYPNVSITQPESVPANTVFKGSLAIEDPNDSTFFCAIPFSFIYGEMLTSVISPEKEHFRVYPNPCSGPFTLSLPSTPAEVIISDVQGRILQHQTISTPVSNLTPGNSGIYFVTVKSESGTYTHRLVVSE